MKKKLWLAPLLMVAGFFIFMGVASAQSFRSEPTVTVAGEEVVDSSLWAAGRRIDVAGTVNGDVICAGQNITISGTVNGDVICAGQNITISGVVEGDVRLAAQTVNINGNIDGSATVASQDASMSADSTIGRDASFAATEVVLNGDIGRDLSIATDSATLSGQIQRNIKATLDNLTLTNNARVGGALNYTSPNNAVIADGAVVEGRVTKGDPKQEPTRYGSVLGFGLKSAFFIALALLVTALVLTLLFPKTLHAATQQAVNSPWKTLLTGFIASIAAPVIFILLAITVIGIPLALIFLLAWLLVCVLSGVFSAYYTGRLIWRDQENPLLIMLVGAVLLLLLYFIPIVGFFAVLAAFWLGSGMILLDLYNRTPRPSYTMK